MRRFFLCQCLSLDFFFNATFHTTLPLTSSFLVSPRGSVPLCLPFVCENECMSVYVYVYVYVCVECVSVCVCICVCVCVCGVSVCVWKDGERTVRRAKSGETPVEASRDTNAQIVRETFFMGAKDKSNISRLVPSNVSPRITGASQLRQVRRMVGGIGTCCSRSVLKLKIYKIQGFLC